MNAPLAADVGIVAAMEMEAGYILDGLENVHEYAGPVHKIIEGEYAGKIVALVIGGMGRAAAREAAEILIAGHRPSWILSAGFGGALVPTLRRNDVVMPTTIIDLEGSRFQVDVSIPPTELTDPNPTPRLLTGTLVTVDSIAYSIAEKTALRERSKADVVDMESSAVAAVCAARSVRFLGIRVISDVADENLPADVINLGTHQGSRLVGSALRTLWNRPSSLMDMWDLQQKATAAADRLANVVFSAVKRLP